MKSKRVCLVLVLVLVLLASSRVRADSLWTPTPWVSLSAGGGISVPLPLSSVPLKIEPVKATFVPELEFHISHRLSVAFAASLKEFGRHESLYRYVRLNDYFAKPTITVLATEKFGFYAFVPLGVTQGEKFYETPVTINGKPDYSKLAKVKTQLFAFVVGAGAKLSFYPVDFVGIYATSDVIYRVNQDLKLYEGKSTLDVQLGLELHF